MRGVKILSILFGVFLMWVIVWSIALLAHIFPGMPLQDTVEKVTNDVLIFKMVVGVLAFAIAYFVVSRTYPR